MFLQEHSPGGVQGKLRNHREQINFPLLLVIRLILALSSAQFRT